MCPMFESLESRELFSGAVAPMGPTLPPANEPTGATVEVPMTRAATVKTYNLMSLLGYDRRGRAWNYGLTYWFDNDGQTGSGNASSTIKVSTKTRTLDGKKANVVSIPSGSVQAGGSFYADSKGTYLLAVDQGIPGAGQTHLRVHGLQIAPAKLKVGQRYSDAGTFTATFTVMIAGKEYSGTVNGRVKSVLKLVDQENAVTHAGVFPAVRVQWDLTLTGTVTLNFNGTPIKYDLNSTSYNKYLASPGIGIVHSDTEIDNRYISQSPFVPSVRTAISTTFDLKSYSL